MDFRACPIACGPDMTHVLYGAIIIQSPCSSVRDRNVLDYHLSTTGGTDLGFAIAKLYPGREDFECHNSLIHANIVVRLFYNKRDIELFSL